MSGTQVADERDTTDLVWLWSSFFAAPFAWTFNQGLAYAVMKPVCAAAAGYALPVIAVAALGFVAIGALVATRYLLARHATARVDGARDRSYFVAVLAVAFNALIGLLIIDSMIAQVFLSPCD